MGTTHKKVSYKNSSVFTHARETCQDLHLLAHKRRFVGEAGVCLGSASGPVPAELGLRTEVLPLFQAIRWSVRCHCCYCRLLGMLLRQNLLDSAYGFFFFSSVCSHHT